MEQAAADFNVELRFLLPASPGDGEEQRQLLHREVENGAAAILLFPADRGVLAEEVRAGSATAGRGPGDTPGWITPPWARRWPKRP